MSKRIAISSVTTGERLREDMGDLVSLAESIDQYGLLHPIVVDNQRNLVAGQRRLEACRLLGQTTIEVVWYDDLSLEDREAMELEENLRRKDLTPFEKSKFITRQKERAIKEPEEEEEGEEDSRGASPRESKKRKRGGQTKKGSARDVAGKVGKDPHTITDAERHVAAGEKYPFLQARVWSQKAALEMAAILDEIGGPDVEYLYRFCSNGRGGKTKEIRKIFESWNAADASTKKKLRRRLDREEPGNSATMSILADCAPNPDAAVLWAADVIPRLRRLIEKRPKGDGLLTRMREALKALESFQHNAREFHRKSVEDLRKELLS